MVRSSLISFSPLADPGYYATWAYERAWPWPITHRDAKKRLVDTLHDSDTLVS